MIETDYARAVAEHCGAHPGVVAEILNLSRKNDCLYHGISMSTALDYARYHGLQTRATKDKLINETVWSFGKCLFSRDGSSPESTEYSTFFGHAHHKLGVSLAISTPYEMDFLNIAILERNPFHSRLGVDDGTFVIRQFLPRRYYSLLNVGLPVTIQGEDPARSRRVGMAGEAKMMELLAGFLRDGAEIGITREARIDNIP
jgi:hypothetical protein